MDKYRKASILFLSIILMLTGCATRTVSFSNMKNVSVQERNAAIIKDDYFHYVGVINKISFLNRSTGKFEEIFSKAHPKPGYIPQKIKFVLQPGTYNISYSKKTYKGLWAYGSGHVELKSGHEYRVNHASCSLYATYKRFCTSKLDAIWFEDLTTGEVLSGYKWKHLSDKSTSSMNKEDEVSCERIKKDYIP